VVWVVKDDSVSAAFVDVGAGQFFLDSLSQENAASAEKDSSVVKRAKYTSQEVSKLTKETRGTALGPDWHTGKVSIALTFS